MGDVGGEKGALRHLCGGTTTKNERTVLCGWRRETWDKIPIQWSSSCRSCKISGGVARTGCATARVRSKEACQQGRQGSHISRIV